MNEVNQLILDCLARVLRINQTTDADIDFRVFGCVNSVQCCGHKHGYLNDVAEFGERPKPDFVPITPGPCSFENYAYEDIYIDQNGAEQKLRDLLASLDALERELMQSA